LDSDRVVSRFWHWHTRFCHDYKTFTKSLSEVELAVKKQKTARFRAFQAQKQRKFKKNALFQPKDLQIQKKAVPLHRNSDKDMQFGV